MPDSDEKRRFFREQAAFALVYSIKAPLSTRNEFGIAEHDAIANNLSEEGLCLFTDIDLPVTTVLVLKFRLISLTGSSPEDRSRKMELEAEVRHSTRSKLKATFLIGAHFMRLSDGDRAFIAAAITG